MKQYRRYLLAVLSVSLLLVWHIDARGEDVVYAPNVDPNATDVEKSSDYTYDYETYCDFPYLFSDLLKDVGNDLRIATSTLTTPLMSDAELIAISQGAYNDWGQWYEMDSDPQLVEYLNSLLQEVLPYVTHKNLDWRVVVVNGPDKNAYSTPGGWLFFFAPLLEEITTEAEIVGVIAHEVGHAEARHSAMLYQYAKLFQMVENEQNDGGVMLLITNLASFTYSRFEAEADAFSMRVMFELGYSPYRSIEHHERGEQLIGDWPHTQGSLAEILLAETYNTFVTHPRFRQRACSIIRELKLRLHPTKDTIFYVGEQNYKNRIPRSKKQY